MKLEESNGASQWCIPCLHLLSLFISLFLFNLHSELITTITIAGIRNRDKNTVERKKGM